MEANLEQVRKDFEKAVDAYTDAFLRQFESEPLYSWWVGGRKGLDFFCFNDTSAITLADMVYVLENGVTYDEYLKYEDYCEHCHEYGFSVMNLRSWHEGAPRISKEAFDRLDEMKKDLNKAVSDIEEQMKIASD